MNEKAEDRKLLETWIRDDYKKVQNYLRGNPGVEGFMDSLITMEDDIRAYLRETLKTKKYGEDPENTNVFEKYMKGGKDRKYLETLVLNKVIGKKTSIDDLLDNGRARVRKLFSTKEAFDTALKKGLIQNIEIKNVILPPDPKDPPEIGSGSGFEKKELEQDKFLLFMDMLRNLKIYSDDILIIHSGILKSNMMRENTYHVIYMPRINKTVFLNVGYGEASFVCDGEVSLEVMTTYGKEKLQTELGAIKIIFSEENIQGWENSFKNALLGEGGKVGEKVSKEKIKEIKEKINKEIIQRNIRATYNQHKDEIQQFFSSANKYATRINQLKGEEKEIFDGFPKTFKGLIPLLGGDKCCQNGGYVLALLESEEAGKTYLEERVELTGDDIREIYRKYKDEIQQFFGSPNKYNTRINQLKGEEKEIFDGFPQSFQGLVSLLGGDTTCSEGGYVFALLESEEAGKTYLEERVELTGDDIREIYRKYKDEIQQFFSNAKKYKTRINQLKGEEKEIFGGFPQSFQGLVSLLGGDTTCSEGGYVIALLESEDTGNLYLQDRKQQKEEEEKNKLTGDDIREIYRKYKDEIQQFFSSANKYKTRINQLKGEEKEIFDGFPKTFRGLVSLLGGDTTCSEGGYILGLLESQDAGGLYLQDRKQQKEEEEKNKLTGDDIREIYRKYKDKIQQFFRYPKKYNTRINQLKGEEKEIFDGFPKSFKGLIPLLGGDKCCQSGGYIIALLESEAKGEEYLKARKEKRFNS